MFVSHIVIPACWAVKKSIKSVVWVTVVTLYLVIRTSATLADHALMSRNSNVTTNESITKEKEKYLKGVGEE